ncbi:MAG: FeoC-like transcriptional regulator [Anaerolineales bacterium]
MIEELLSLLATGRPHTLGSLAETLGVSADLLAQMLADLERAGYVSVVEVQCGGQAGGYCAGCPSAGLCGLLQGKRLWTLTERGRRAAGEQPTSLTKGS